MLISFANLTFDYIYPPVHLVLNVFCLLRRWLMNDNTSLKHFVIKLEICTKSSMIVVCFMWLVLAFLISAGANINDGVNVNVVAALRVDISLVVSVVGFAVDDAVGIGTGIDVNIDVESIDILSSVLLLTIELARITNSRCVVYIIGCKRYEVVLSKDD